MELTFKVPEKDLVEFGKDTIQQEISKTLKWMKIKQSFRQISDALQEADEESYHSELEKIRENSWQEYKNDFEL